MKIEQITDKITLICGDCMEYMKTLQDKAFDLIIADPPYGDGNFQQPPHQQAMSRNGGGWFSRYKRSMETLRSAVRPLQANCGASQGGLRDTAEQIYPPPQFSDSQGVKRGIWWDIAPTEDYFKELFRVSNNQIIWGGNYFGLPPTRCFLIWRKLSISEKFSMAMAEYAWTSFNANAKVFEHTPQGTKNDPRFHPTQKPIKLYLWQMQNYAKEGQRILDPNLGSGSSAIAAYDLSFEFVGIEIDEEYYENAKARLLRHIEQDRQQPSLFTPSQD